MMTPCAALDEKSAPNYGQSIARNLRAFLYYQNIAPKLSAKLCLDMARRQSNCFAFVVCQHTIYIMST